jgi:intracellular multiplication protein IcmG
MNNNNDNDDIDDDFDMNDDSHLDEIIDVEIDDELDEDFASDDDDEQSDTKKSKRSGSLKKYVFLGFVIAVFAVVGFVDLNSGTTPVTMPLESTMPAADIAADAPPMPAPISSEQSPVESASSVPPEELDVSAELSSPEIQTDEVLTPMPEEQLAEVEVSENLEPLDASDTESISDDQIPLAEAQATPEIQQNEPLQEEAIIVSDVSEPALEAEATQDVKADPTPATAPAVEEEIKAEVIEEPVVDTQNQISQEPSPVANVEAPLNSEINSQWEEKLSQLEKKMNDQIGAMQAESDQKDKQLASLQEKISNLENDLQSKNNEIEEFKNKISSKPEDEDTPSDKISENKTESDILVKTPAVKPVRKSLIKEAPKRSDAPNKPAITWELRSAQSGKASVAIKGSGDIQDVEPGDVLKGVGKITSITRQNGQWVVQGTTGRIVQ